MMDSEPNELTDILVICISTDGCDKLKENSNAERFSHCGIMVQVDVTYMHAIPFPRHCAFIKTMLSNT